VDIKKADRFNLCIAYDWEYDRDFIRLLCDRAAQSNITTYIVDSNNIESSIQAFKDNSLSFDFFIDRASDTTPDFLPLNRAVQKASIPHLDPFDGQSWACDKATMHLEFITNGINTPYSIIIPPYKGNKEIYISVSDLAKLGRSFIIKPAINSGGGIGVVQGAETLMDVLQARMEYEDDKYLLQEMIRPLLINDKPCWFRGFFACDFVLCTWWDPETHLYSILTEEEVSAYSLSPVFGIIRKISKICKLRFFSTEIVFTDKHQFVVVDYVNITSDMRLKSFHRDGVPDEIVYRIVENIIAYVDSIIHARGKIESEPNPSTTDDCRQ
jgi:hypothetical protein